MLYLILLALASSGLMTFLVPYIINTLVFKSRDLKKAYNAKWALVTGASSGAWAPPSPSPAAAPPTSTRHWQVHRQEACRAGTQCCAGGAGRACVFNHHAGTVRCAPHRAASQGAPFSHVHTRSARTTVLQVAVDLSKPGYMETIADATSDVDVQVVFNNAGYIITGFFEDRYALAPNPDT